MASTISLESEVREFAREFPTRPSPVRLPATPSVQRAVALCESGRLSWAQVHELFRRSVTAEDLDLALDVAARDLRRAEARYQRASQRAEEARLERNRLVREALEAGWTHAQIAEATGLTRGRIGQIAMR